MRRILGFAVLAVAAAAPLLPTAPASACEPKPVVGCPTPCSLAQSTYTTVRNAAQRGPYWSDLNLGTCGT